MHTELDTTATEAYLSAHRVHVAVLGWAFLTPLAILVWVLFLDIVCRIQSTNLNVVSAVIISALTATTALAYYWGAE